MESTNSSCSGRSKVMAVNHGARWGHADWYTFHCPKCMVQLEPRENECRRCKTLIEWEADRDERI